MISDIVQSTMPSLSNNDDHRLIYWRHSHPLQLIWYRFLQRAKRRFTNQLKGKRYTWEEHGKQAVHIALQRYDKKLPSDCKMVLTWKLGVDHCDMDDLVLLPRHEAETRARRKGRPNKRQDRTKNRLHDQTEQQLLQALM
jgi:hypothetical protein